MPGTVANSFRWTYELVSAKSPRITDWDGICATVTSKLRIQTTAIVERHNWLLFDGTIVPTWVIRVSRSIRTGLPALDFDKFQDYRNSTVHMHFAIKKSFFPRT